MCFFFFFFRQLEHLKERGKVGEGSAPNLSYDFLHQRRYLLLAGEVRVLLADTDLLAWASVAVEATAPRLQVEGLEKSS